MQRLVLDIAVRSGIAISELINLTPEDLLTIMEITKGKESVGNQKLF
jgi:hypothetical protein